MRIQSRPAQAVVNSDSHSPTDTRLQGPWLALLRLGWVMLSMLAVMIFIASVPVSFASQWASYTPGYAVFLLALTLFVALIWFIVALLIFWRKSDDWMALLVSFMLVVQGAASTIYPLDSTSSVWLLPAVILDMLAFDLLFLVFCLFPTGRFVPRWIGWLTVIFAVIWLGVLLVEAFQLLPDSSDLLFVLVLYCFLGGFVVSQLYRYHAVSRRMERQQTKWIVFGVTVTYLVEFGYTFCSSFFPSFLSTGSLTDMILSPLVNGLPILIPLSFGFAILRSGLWEIDTIINRTLVYGTLTALLALVYAGLVIGLQYLLDALTGQVSDVAVAISTLAIVALFQPLRRSIQAIIDHRFYRRKYDAAKTLTAFSATLRSKVDLDDLSSHLVTVVEETMQPTHVSLWLRQP